MSREERLLCYQQKVQKASEGKKISTVSSVRKTLDSLKNEEFLITAQIGEQHHG